MSNSSLLTGLAALGCNVADGLDRFGGNEAMYEKFLKKFPLVCSDLNVLPMLVKGDIEGAIEKAHTLKGSTGNLSLTPLFVGYTKIVGHLRAQEVDAAYRVLVDILPIQTDIINCIQTH